MKKNPLKTTLLALPLAATLVSADTIIMEDGTEYEGVIVREEDDHYVALVQVTETIRDQRELPKDQVREIIAEKKDETAFEELGDLVPTPDLLPPREYENRIRQVETFLENHGDSDLAEKAEKIRDTLSEEHEMILNGGVKLNGEMIPPEEAEARAYPLDARIIAERFKSHADAGRRTMALRAWSELADDFSRSSAFLENRDRALDLMRAHLAFVRNELSMVEQRVQEREEGLAQVPDRDRERTRRAIEEESAEYEERVKAEEEAGVKWLSLSPYHEDPLQDVQRELERSIRSLEDLDTSEIPDADAAWTEAWEILSEDPTSDEARKAMSTARSARLPEKYMDKLKALEEQAQQD